MEDLSASGGLARHRRIGQTGRLEIGFPIYIIELMANDSAISGLFFGISTIDCLYLVDHPPHANQKITAQRQLLCTGGPSTNAAITFSALGGNATLISCLGDHPLTAIAYNEFDTFAIDHRDCCPKLHKSRHHPVPAVSSIYITAESGYRSVVSINASHLPSIKMDMGALALTQYQTALFDGQYMTHAIELAKTCRKSGLHTILDGGSWKPGTETLIQYIDTAICSSAFHPPGTDTHDDSLSWLMDQKVTNAAITRGGKPILATENGKRFEVTPPKISTVCDTLAAGDIFHGAYAFYATRFPSTAFGRLLEKSAEIAGKACAYFGPRKWIDHFQPGETGKP